jgi:hypothetical protein
MQQQQQRREEHHNVIISEEQRQLLILALAHLGAARPGWNYSLRECAKVLGDPVGKDGNPSTYERLRSLAYDSRPHRY